MHTMKQPTPEDRRRSWRCAALMVMVIACVAAIAYLLPRTRTASDSLLERAEKALMLSDAAAELDEISASLVFSPESETHLTCVQTLTLRNRTGTAQDAVMLRSYTGAYLRKETSPAASDELFSACYPGGFSPGGVVVDSAHVGGVATPVHCLDDAMTVLSLPLEAPWLPGETLSVTLRWHATVPECASRFGVSGGVWALGNLFPVPALWESGVWRTDPYVAIGDPFQSECVRWSLSLTLPRGYHAAATCGLTKVESGAQLTLSGTAPAVRDFALVIRPGGGSCTLMEGSTRITAYATYRARAREMAQYAARAVRCYEARYGPYLYPELTLCEVDFPYGGMEYPGLVMIGADAVSAGGQVLETAVAHETAHQWWAMQVGSDSFNQPWQDESLCEYALMDYIGAYYGADSRERSAQALIETAMRAALPGGLTPATPIDRYERLDDYATVAYERGAALWMALEELMGKGALDGALRDYALTYRFRRASRQELTALLSQHAGMDLAALMSSYLDNVPN